MKPISIIPERYIFGKKSKQEILEKGKYVCSFDLYYLKKLLREAREKELPSKEQGVFAVIKTKDKNKFEVFAGFIAIKGKYCPIIASRCDEELKDIMKKGCGEKTY